MNKMNCRKTNPRLSLISLLKTTSSEHEVNIWREIADRLEAPGGNYAEVNTQQDQPVCGNGETILVPGKVLGSGVLESPSGGGTQLQ